MRTGLIALSVATADAWILFVIRQAQVVDTSVWIALIAGVVGLLTLIIQSYTALQTAKIKDKQAEQTAASQENSRKISDQGKQLTEAATKLQEVHTVVNSGQSRLIEDVKTLTAKVAELTGEKTERARADAQEQNRLIGAAHIPVAPNVAVATANPVPVLGATDSKPLQVEVANKEPVKVVETKTESKE